MPGDYTTVLSVQPSPEQPTTTRSPLLHRCHDQALPEFSFLVEDDPDGYYWTELREVAWTVVDVVNKVASNKAS